MEVEVIPVYSFTTIEGHGNPAGVVLSPQGLSDEQMMEISKKLQVSETAFLFSSDEADFFVRFFSPTSEVDLCGHATIAAFSLLGNNLDHQDHPIVEFRQKTHAGILRVHCQYEKHVLIRVMMEQHPLVTESIEFEDVILADALNIKNEHIISDFQKNRVSTGLFTLPVCIDSLDILKMMKPDFPKIKTLCTLLGVGSMHVFTFDSLNETSIYHARNFAPLYGINEDPVTGTANGAVCAYLHKNKFVDNKEMICEQGDIINRPGRVYVDVSNHPSVWVGGTAVIGTPITLNV